MQQLEVSVVVLVLRGHEVRNVWSAGVRVSAHIFEIVPAAVIGVVCGLAGVLFLEVILKVRLASLEQSFWHVIHRYARHVHVTLIT